MPDRLKPQTLTYRWLRRALVFLSILFVVMTAILTALITTTQGAKFVLQLSARVSPTPIHFEHIHGSLFSGVSIKMIRINDSVVMRDTHLSWRWQSNFQLYTRTASIDFSNLSEQITDSLPEALAKKIHRLSRLQQTRLEYNVFTNQLQADVHYHGQDYRLSYDGSRSGTVIFHSGPSQEKLALSFQQRTDHAFVTFAHGTIYLPNGEIFLIDEWQTEVTIQGIHLALSGQSKSKNTQLNLRAQTDNFQDMRIQLALLSPDYEIDAQGMLGQQSDLVVSVNNRILDLGSLQAEQNHLKIKLTQQWQQPSISADFSAEKVHLDGIQAHGIQLHYDLNSEDLSSVLRGKTSLTVKKIIGPQALVFTNLSLSNLQSPAGSTFNIHANQGQHEIDGKFQVSIDSSTVHLALDKLNFDQYQLFDPNIPQRIHITSQQVTFESPKSSKNPSLISISGSWHFRETTQIELNVNGLQVAHLPLDLLRVALPSLEAVRGEIHMQIQLDRAHSDQALNTRAQFSFDVKQIYINSLIENLPLDSSLNIHGGKLVGTLDSEMSAQGDLLTERGTIHIDIHSTNAMQKIQGQVSGKNIQLGHGKNNRIDLSTSSDFIYENNQLSINSNLLVNQAEFRLGFFRPVTYLPYETIIQSKVKQDNTAMRYKFTTKIDLGKNTQIHVIGFHGKLGGNLTINGSESTPIMANGGLDLNNGTLVIYKQTLPIERMTLSWFNSPISLPAINLKILAKGLRDIDGRDQMQSYGLRAYGLLDNIRFDYFSSPSPMNSFQIIMALLTDSSYSKKSNSESLDQTLSYYHSGQRNAQLSEILEILNAVKSIPFFDNIDVSEINFDNLDGDVPEVNGITITKRLDKYFSLRYRIAPSSQRSNRISLDTNLSNSLILTNFVQNEGDVGVAVNYFGSK